MDRISQTMPPLPHSSTSLNLFVCCTCLLDTFQPCLSPFALSIPKSPSFPPTTPLPFLFPPPDFRGLDAKFRDIFLKDGGTEIKKKTEALEDADPLVPVYHLLFISLEKSMTPSLEPRRPLLSLVSPLTFLRPPVKFQQPPFPSELTAFSDGVG